MPDFLDPSRVVRSLAITEGMKVADFGCGTGIFTVLLAKRVGPQGKISAVDVQQAPLESVSSRAKAEGLGQIEIIHADLEVLGGTGIPDGTQDAVLLANALFQSPNKPAILKEAHRVLKDGGLLILVEWAKDSGGLGPLNEMRTDQATMKSIVVGENFNYANSVDAGNFHYALLFRK